MRTLNQPYSVVFDMDGLLIDSERPALTAFEACCEQYGLSNPKDLYAQLLGLNHQATLEHLRGLLPDESALDEFCDHWEDQYQTLTRDGIPLMPGVLQLLDYLDTRSIRMIVATSTDTKRALARLEQVKVLDRFTTIIGGDQVRNGKPAPDIYLKAAETLEVEPQHCVAFEDSDNGVRAALAAGMHTIQIPQLFEPDKNLHPSGHTILPGLEQAPGYLDQLSRDRGLQ